jgi:hypothetical protein
MMPPALPKLPHGNIPEMSSNMLIIDRKINHFASLLIDPSRSFVVVITATV